MNYALTLNTECKITISWYALLELQFHFLQLMVVVFIMSTSIALAAPQPEDAVGMEKEHQNTMQPQSLSEQISNLSLQVSELQAKVRDQGVDAVAMKANGDESRSKKSMGIPSNVPQASGMQPNTQIGTTPKAPQMGMMDGMMSMMNSMMGGMAGTNAPMGQASSMGSSTLLSVLPGFPGASHLYHIGSTNFFLDHPDHITLSLEQQSGLADIRMKALMKRADFNRKIQEVEEQIWLFTASDQPNVANIEAKIRESEKLQGDSRLAFIKDIGEAAKILTDEQRKALLGQPQAMGDM